MGLISLRGPRCDLAGSRQSSSTSKGWPGAPRSRGGQTGGFPAWAADSQQRRGAL